MDINALQALVIDALEDIKAKDIEVIDTSKFNSLFDRLVIASGNTLQDLLPKPMMRRRTSCSRTIK